MYLLQLLLLSGTFQAVGVEVCVGKANAEFIIPPGQFRYFSSLPVTHSHARSAPVFVEILLIVAEFQGFQQRCFSIVEIDFLSSLFLLVYPALLLAVARVC